MLTVIIVLTPIFYIISSSYINIRKRINHDLKYSNYYNINEILSNILSKCLLIFHIIEEIILHYFKLSNSYNSNLRYILCSIFLIVNALNYFNFKLSFNYVLIPLYSVDIVNTAVDCISGYYGNFD
ncbi:hypothetical protein K502DRAFT_123547 [Neoconidiobolus thromboides FSU 785]|nr:hypothetical protein K502DRAFT_123547 [Neoconidiobolus thromboides FSU 785]